MTTGSSSQSSSSCQSRSNVATPPSISSSHSAGKKGRGNNEVPKGHGQSGSNRHTTQTLPSTARTSTGHNTNQSRTLENGNRTGHSSQPVNRPTHRTNAAVQSSQPVSRTGQSSQQTNRNVGNRTVQPSRTVERSRTAGRPGQHNGRSNHTVASMQVSHRGSPLQQSRTLPSGASLSSQSNVTSGRPSRSQGQTLPHNNSRSVVIANRGASNSPSSGRGVSPATGRGRETQQRAISHSPQRQTTSRPSRTVQPSQPHSAPNQSHGLNNHEIQLDVLQNTEEHSPVLPRNDNNQALPDILNSHVLPPYTAHRQNQHRNPSHSSSRTDGGRQSNSRSRSSQSRTPSGMTSLDGDDKDCCNKDCCISCVTVLTTFRWVLVTLALIGVICVIIGIVLGALHMTVGEKYLTLSLMFIGLGVLLVVVVGVGWRCTPTGHEPCHVLFNLGDYRTPAMSPRVARQTRGNLWHGGMLYSDFRHRRPPPSYNASMQEYRQQQIREMNPAPVAVDNYSLPSSPPPTYRSRASTVRPGIHITFPPVQGDYPTSRPPTYRSHAGDGRPPLSSISGEDIPPNNSTVVIVTTDSSTHSDQQVATTSAEPIGNETSTLHREQEVVRYLDGMLDNEICSLPPSAGEPLTLNRQSTAEHDSILVTVDRSESCNNNRSCDHTGTSAVSGEGCTSAVSGEGCTNSVTGCREGGMNGEDCSQLHTDTRTESCDNRTESCDQVTIDTSNTVPKGTVIIMERTHSIINRDKSETLTESSAGNTQCSDTADCEEAEVSDTQL